MVYCVYTASFVNVKTEGGQQKADRVSLPATMSFFLSMRGAYSRKERDSDSDSDSSHKPRISTISIPSTSRPSRPFTTSDGPSSNTIIRVEWKEGAVDCSNLINPTVGHLGLGHSEEHATTSCSLSVVV